MEMLGAVFLTSATNDGQFYNSATLLLGKQTPSTHWIGIWLDPRGSLDLAERRKNLHTCWESNPDSMVVQTIV
jgi:hypothetical protein